MISIVYYEVVEINHPVWSGDTIVNPLVKFQKKETAELYALEKGNRVVHTICLDLVESTEEIPAYETLSSLTFEERRLV